MEYAATCSRAMGSAGSHALCRQECGAAAERAADEAVSSKVDRVTRDGRKMYWGGLNDVAG